ncbi:MAG: GlxA family transcriptional regulator [Myxococcales bacterium]|nr:GlxA family transcriptional regulator [Myxococcales bacterium]
MTLTPQIPPKRRVALVAPPGVQSLDLVGPLEVFSVANRLLLFNGRPAPYELDVLGVEGSVETSSGLRVETRPLAEARAPHTLIVCGGTALVEAPLPRALLDGVAKLAAKAERVASVCTGAFVLGELGLLDGRRCTTHWLSLEMLRERFGAAQVQKDVLYTRDGNVYTSAGVTSGIDLSLSLLEADLGSKVSLAVARLLVVFLHRSGGQSQFSAALAPRPNVSERLRALLARIAEGPGDDHSVPALAARVGMSARNFARVFKREIGSTPAAYVERVRLDAARAQLESSDATLEAVAERCGFGSAETLRRVFGRAFGVAPSAYRARFSRVA